MGLGFCILLLALLLFVLLDRIVLAGWIVLAGSYRWIVLAGLYGLDWLDCIGS